MNQSNVAILATLEAKANKVELVERFLKEALALAQNEQETLTWFALKLGPTTFGIFDTFADDSGRQKHLQGKIAAALMESADELLSTAPNISQVEVLAAKD